MSDELILVESKEKCCGCSSCKFVCSQNAITMELDEEGFLYPSIDSSKCIRCKKCLSACVFKKNQLNRQRPLGKYTKPITYAVKHKDISVRKMSRSGGFFTAISDMVLSEGGVVYGCVLNDKLNAVHIRASSEKDRNRMRGSKYIQSDMNDVYSLVKDDVEDKKKVLFSGTSCQIAGLYSYLGYIPDNLTTVDIVCHGVPSPKVWQSYLKWQEKKNNSKIIKVDFRNKIDYGWADHVESLYLDNGNRVDSRVFTKLFYSHSILRPCCFECPYKSIIHPGNITIADYWGVEKAAPGFEDDIGISLVMVNDDIGNRAFESVDDALDIVVTRIEDSIQPPLQKPFERPLERERVWEDYKSLPFDEFVKKYGRLTLIEKVKSIIRYVYRRLLKNNGDSRQ